jgi:hypothetical protein
MKGALKKRGKHRKQKIVKREKKFILGFSFLTA